MGVYIYVYVNVYMLKHTLIYTHLLEEALPGEAATLVVSALTVDNVHPAEDQAAKPRKGK